MRFCAENICWNFKARILADVLSQNCMESNAAKQIVSKWFEMFSKVSHKKIVSKRQVLARYSLILARFWPISADLNGGRSGEGSLGTLFGREGHCSPGPDGYWKRQRGKQPSYSGCSSNRMKKRVRNKLETREVSESFKRQFFFFIYKCT